MTRTYHCKPCGFTAKGRAKGFAVPNHERSARHELLTGFARGVSRG